MRGGYSEAMARFMLRRPCLEYICGNRVRYISQGKNLKTNKCSHIFSGNFRSTKQTKEVRYISQGTKITKETMEPHIYW